MAEGIITVRIGREREDAILAFVERKEYPNLTAFINECIDEKMDKNVNKARLKRQVFELIRTDPDIRKELGL